MFRVIVCGGRDFHDRPRLAQAMFRHLPVRQTDRIVVVHGACRGADLLAADIADCWGLKVEPHRADWQKYGRRAAHIRNQAMADAGADLCIAAPGGPGTADMVRRASRAGIQVVFA